MPFLECAGIGAEFVVDFLPDPARILLQQFPVTMDLENSVNGNSCRGQIRIWWNARTSGMDSVGFGARRACETGSPIVWDAMGSPDIVRRRLSTLRPRPSCLGGVCLEKPTAHNPGGDVVIMIAASACGIG